MKRDNNIQNKPTIICVALTGSVPRKKHNNNVPISSNSSQTHSNLSEFVFIFIDFFTT